MTNIADLLTSVNNSKVAIKAALEAQGVDTAGVDLSGYAAKIAGIRTSRWGIKIAKADSNPDTRVTYLYDAAGMTPAAMNYSTGVFDYGDWQDFCEAINRPVMLTSGGEVAYELSRADQTKKENGVDASDIANTAFAGNAMAEFKRLWIKCWEDANYLYVVFSNIKYDDDYHADAFTDANGNIHDAFYHAMYEGSNVSSVLRSLATGAVMVSQAGATEISYAEANGVGHYISTWSQRFFITALLILISKSTNGQAKFGQGNSSSAAYIAPGALKSVGQFWGDDAVDAAVKVFFVENFWGNYWKRCAGLLYAQADGHVYTRNTPPYNDTGSGYDDSGKSLSGTSGTHLVTMTIVNNALVPVAGGGAETQYYCDGLWYATPGAGLFHYALVGGYRDSAGLCGPAAVNPGYPLSTAYSNVGAALSFLKSAS